MQVLTQVQVGQGQGHALGQRTGQTLVFRHSLSLATLQVEQSQHFSLGIHRLAQVRNKFVFGIVRNVLTVQAIGLIGHHMGAASAHPPARLRHEDCISEDHLAPIHHRFEYVLWLAQDIYPSAQAWEELPGILFHDSVNVLVYPATLQQVAHFVEEQGVLVALLQRIDKMGQFLVRLA